MPSHWMRALESTGCAGRIERCGRRSSWARDAASASMAAANRANPGPRGACPPWAGCATRAGLLVGGRDRRVGSELRGAGHALHAAPRAPWVAPTVLGASATRAPETFWRLIRLAHRGSSWRSRDQRKLRVEPLAVIRGAPAVESAGHRCASTPLSFLPPDWQLGSITSRPARTFLPWICFKYARYLFDI
jgi:hypothetical protein